MGAFFQSLGRTIVAGLVILAVIIVAASAIWGGGAKMGDHAWFAFIMRWLHVLSGVMWIGLLWYFNFVQTPSMPKIPDEQKPAVSKVIAPEALFWFRWAAGFCSSGIFGIDGVCTKLKYHRSPIHITPDNTCSQRMMNANQA